MKQVKADDISQYLVYDMAMLASQVSAPLAKWQRLIFVITSLSYKALWRLFYIKTSTECL